MGPWSPGGPAGRAARGPRPRLRRTTFGLGGSPSATSRNASAIQRCTRSTRSAAAITLSASARGTAWPAAPAPAKASARRFPSQACLGKPRASASSQSRWALIQQTSETPGLHASAALAHKSLCAKFGTEPAVR